MEKYGKLTVIEVYKVKQNGRSAKYCKCKCDCGNVIIKRYSEVKNGRIKSCGCLVREILLKRNTTHGLSKSPVHKIYHGMLKRCYDKNHNGYQWYGGKGITVCDEWKNDFKNFHEWAMSNGYEKGLTLDRIDGEKNYTPSNCRWETVHNQHRNMSSNVFIGSEICHDFLKRISEENSLCFETLRYRYYSLKNRGIEPTEYMLINYEKFDGRNKHKPINCQSL